MIYKKHNKFYDTPAWRKKRKQILIKDKYECQHCKAKGIYTKADTVHHIKPLDKYPQLALSDYYDNEKKQRQLISICRACHEHEHERWKLLNIKEPLTKERWD